MAGDQQHHAQSWTQSGCGLPAPIPEAHRAVMDHHPAQLSCERSQPGAFGCQISGKWLRSAACCWFHTNQKLLVLQGAAGALLPPNTPGTSGNECRNKYFPCKPPLCKDSKISLPARFEDSPVSLHSNF